MGFFRRSWIGGAVGLALLLLSMLAGSAEVGVARDARFTDSCGSLVILSEPPRKVVSLAPAITRIIFALGAGDAVKGLSWRDMSLRETADKTVVGGFLSPSVEKIEALEPDLVFISSLHREARERLSGGPARLVELR